MGDKEINSKELRWDPYLLLSGERLKQLWQEHFLSQNKKALFIMGKGFDVRMNLGLERLLKDAPNIDIELLVINFNEGTNSPSKKYEDLVAENEKALAGLVQSSKLNNVSINLWEGSGKKKRRIGDRKVAELFQGRDSIIAYSDIIIDISALPRGIYFSLIGKLLKVIDFYFDDNIKSPNLFVLTAENADIDANISELGIDEDLHFPHGFGGGVDLESLDIPTVWLPLLGENKSLHFEKANQHIRPDEICPLLPFPSKNPRRSDDIFKDHHGLFFDVLRIESQNIMYVPEQNPFEVYRKIVFTIRNYQDSLSVLKGCKAVISTFSSKLLSIGALLAAYECKDEVDSHVGILNVDSQGYEIIDLNRVNQLRDKSELFVIWLSGKPYHR